MPEAIVTDLSLTDMDRMTREEKGFLECCANRVIFESNPRRRTMTERYEAKDTTVDRLVKVIDAIESGVDALAINMSREHFDEFIGTADQNARKHPDLSLAFASKAINDIRTVYALWREDLQKDYATPQERRKAILELVL